MGAVLDVEELIEENYNLEVSSPGLTRPLKKLSDFERCKGQHAKIKCFEPVDGDKKLVGIISGVNEDEVTFTIDGLDKIIKYKNIAKANLEFVQED